MNVRHTLRLSVFSSAVCALFFLSASLPAAVETPVVTESVKLHSATVFLRGAELFGSAETALPAGESELILENIATNFNRQKLTLNAGETRTLRFSYTVRYPKDRNVSNL